MAKLHFAKYQLQYILKIKKKEYSSDNTQYKLFCECNFDKNIIKNYNIKIHNQQLIFNFFKYKYR